MRAFLLVAFVLVGCRTAQPAPPPPRGVLGISGHATVTVTPACKLPAPEKK